MIDLKRDGNIFTLVMTDGQNRWNTTFVRAFTDAIDEVEASDGPAALVDMARGLAKALDEARRTGLLDGARTEEVSFRAPRALVEAARRASGVTSSTALGILALASLARPDAPPGRADGQT